MEEWGHYSIFLNKGGFFVLQEFIGRIRKRRGPPPQFQMIFSLRGIHVMNTFSFITDLSLDFHCLFPIRSSVSLRYFGWKHCFAFLRAINIQHHFFNNALVHSYTVKLHLIQDFVNWQSIIFKYSRESSQIKLFWLLMIYVYFQRG